MSKTDNSDIINYRILKEFEHGGIGFDYNNITYYIELTNNIFVVWNFDSKKLQSKYLFEFKNDLDIDKINWLNAPDVIEKFLKLMVLI